MLNDHFQNREFWIRHWAEARAILLRNPQIAVDALSPTGGTPSDAEHVRWRIEIATRRSALRSLRRDLATREPALHTLVAALRGCEAIDALNWQASPQFSAAVIGFGRRILADDQADTALIRRWLELTEQPATTAWQAFCWALLPEGEEREPAEPNKEAVVRFRYHREWKRLERELVRPTSATTRWDRIRAASQYGGRPEFVQMDFEHLLAAREPWHAMLANAACYWRSAGEESHAVAWRDEILAKVDNSTMGRELVLAQLADSGPWGFAHPSVK